MLVAVVALALSGLSNDAAKSKLLETYKQMELIARLTGDTEHEAKYKRMMSKLRTGRLTEKDQELFSDWKYEKAHNLTPKYKPLPVLASSLAGTPKGALAAEELVRDATSRKGTDPNDPSLLKVSPDLEHTDTESLLKAMDKMSLQHAKSKKLQTVPPAVPTPAPKSAVTRVKRFCGSEEFPSADPKKEAECVKCVKAHIGAEMQGEPKFDFACTLADVGSLCSVSEAGKSKEETMACEAELKQYCKKQVRQGPTCVSCVKDHMQNIDDGLVGNSMCSSFQLNQYCFFQGVPDKMNPGR
eukprot:g708.t1